MNREKYGETIDYLLILNQTMLKLSAVLPDDLEVHKIVTSIAIDLSKLFDKTRQLHEAKEKNKALYDMGHEL